jgi:hypothetical protein
VTFIASFKPVHRIAAGALLLAMLVGANLHLPLLQVAAWAGMLVNFSQEVELAEAVEMTFNGENPCPMCTAIKQAQTQANDHDEWLSAGTVRLELCALLNHADLVFPGVRQGWPVSGEVLCPSSFHTEPPVPPPRFLPV